MQARGCRESTRAAAAREQRWNVKEGNFATFPSLVKNHLSTHHHRFQTVYNMPVKTHKPQIALDG